MSKIDLTVYKETKYYFQLFDILIRERKLTKEPFLKEIGISPSSYRKSRITERNAGEKISETLCEHLGYNKANYELVCSVEKLLNKVYKNIYYKIYTTYKEDLAYIDQLIDGNYIIFPILKLIKIFIIANSKMDADLFVENYYEIYDELQKYFSFFNEDLLEIFDIISLAFDERINENMIFKEYNNSLAYCSLSSRLWKDGKYLECLFLSQKTEEVLVKEQNYRRLVSLNVTRIYCLNALGNYQESYELSENMLATIKSFNEVDYESKYIVSHLALSCLPLKKYKYCSELLLNKNKVSLTDICCILIAKFFTNKKEYESLLEHYLGIVNNEDKFIFKCLDGVLKRKNLKSLNALNSPKLIRYFPDLLKNMIFGRMPKTDDNKNK